MANQQTQLDQQIVEVLKKMSVESGIGIQDLTSEHKALTQELGNPVGALAKLKSNHKFQLGGKTGMFTGRIISKGMTKNNRGFLDVWVQSAPGNYEQKPRRIWDTDDVAYSTNFQVNQLVQWNGKLMPKGDTSIVLSGTVNPTNIMFPTVAELVEKIGAVKIKDLDKHLKQNVFIKGTVGKIFTSAFGGGIEICDPLDLESIPVTVYLKDNAATEGQQVIVYGYVGQKDGGDITLNATNIF